MVLSFPFLRHLFCKEQPRRSKIFNIPDLNRQNHAGTDLRHSDCLQLQRLKDPVVILEICLVPSYAFKMVRIRISATPLASALPFHCAFVSSTFFPVSAAASKPPITAFG